MKTLNEYITEGIKIGSKTKVNDDKYDIRIKMISNIVDDYFNKIHIPKSNYECHFNKRINPYKKEEEAINLDELSTITIYSKEFNQINDIDKCADYLYREINKIVKLDNSKTEVLSTIIYFYLKK